MAAAAACAVTGAALMGAGVAGAANGPSVPPSPAAPSTLSVGLAEMGLGQQIAFSGITSERDLTVPVPDGLHPYALTGTLVLPTDVSSGWIEVISGATRVDVVKFDAKDFTAAGAALTIPLTGVPVTARAASLRLVEHLIPLDPTCYDRSFSYPLTITAADVQFTGADTAAQTVADFLPPILRTLTIGVQGTLDSSSRQAVLALSSRIVQRYNGQPVKVSVVQVAGAALPADATPLSRTIVLDPAGADGVRIAATSARPDLVISGSSLSDQIAGLTSDLSQIAQSSSATFSGANTPVTLAPSVFTLADLGLGSLASTGAGTVAVSFGLDQARLGGRPSKLGFDLRATYTPLPSSIGGLLGLYAGSTLVASWPTSRSGQLRTHVDVPARDLTRFTTFSLNLSLTGNTGQCGDQVTDTLTIDPQSSVSVDLATSGLVGFQSLPQSLVPTFDVAIAADDFTSLVRTNDIVDGLQRETSIPLSPQLVTPAEALAARVPALVVYPTSDAPASVDLPLRHADASQYTESAPAGTTASGSVTAPVLLGCIQVADDVAHQRVLVVATSADGSGALLDRVLTWLDASPDRWFGLTGNVVASAATGDPFTLSIGVPEHHASSSTISTAVIVAVSVGVVGVLALLLLGLAARRRRKARLAAGAGGEATR